MDQTFEKRKKVIYDFIRDDHYVPMKLPFCFRFPANRGKNCAGCWTPWGRRERFPCQREENTAADLRSVLQESFRQTPEALDL